MPRPRPWTDDDLRVAVEVSTTLNEVSRHLGISVGGGTYELLRRHMARLGIDSSCFPSTEPIVRSRRSWTNDELYEAVRLSTSVSEVSRRLGYVPNGGVHRYLTAKIQTLGIDCSHFTGRSWSRDPSALGGRRARSLAEILVSNSTYGSSKLRARLIEEGVKGRNCETCGLDQWCGRPLPLTLDHINGDSTDNRLENLRILCPNCHSQTDTWCRRKSKLPSRRTPTRQRGQS